ncbi:hypothetical protein F5Y02DRAFT_251490 [Annulohypoxylon stygium]|nr:hypothetical protein F5Y02DRAFT_251490 [Annulohypoxylon stygium]
MQSIFKISPCPPMSHPPSLFLEHSMIRRTPDLSERRNDELFVSRANFILTTLLLSQSLLAFGLNASIPIGWIRVRIHRIWLNVVPSFAMTRFGNDLLNSSGIIVVEPHGNSAPPQSFQPLHIFSRSFWPLLMQDLALCQTQRPRLWPLRSSGRVVLFNDCRNRCAVSSMPANCVLLATNYSHRANNLRQIADSL